MTAMANNVQVHLFDAETKKSYYLHLTEEDAHKAKNETPSTSSIGGTNSSTSDISDFGDTKSNNEDVYLWNKKETLLLISLYKEHEEMFTSGKTKQNLCWKRIATEMAQKGCNISGKKCCTKFQTLKRTYKQIKDHNNKSGNSRKTWEYLDAMDELCGTKPWIEPISTASSDQNNQPAELLGPIKKHKDKIHATSKNVLLEYRKLRAEKRDAQHKEKMDLLKDIKNLIQDTIQKE
ncbi:uncharacterized protein [Linepithema humile]|uniref:uncharacterized protein isoform X2 n=1 Tax=Linepithema humile TaxID=83485 RepID=UPI00351E0F15